MLNNRALKKIRFLNEGGKELRHNASGHVKVSLSPILKINIRLLVLNESE